MLMAYATRHVIAMAHHAPADAIIDAISFRFLFLSIDFFRCHDAATTIRHRLAHMLLPPCRRFRYAMLMMPLLLSPRALPWLLLMLFDADAAASFDIIDAIWCCHDAAFLQLLMLSFIFFRHFYLFYIFYYLLLLMLRFWLLSDCWFSPFFIADYADDIFAMLYWYASFMMMTWPWCLAADISLFRHAMPPADATTLIAIFAIFILLIIDISFRWCWLFIIICRRHDLLIIFAAFFDFLRFRWFSWQEGGRKAGSVCQAQQSCKRQRAEVRVRACAQRVRGERRRCVQAAGACVRESARCIYARKRREYTRWERQR